MTRIFSVLAVAALILISATLILGLSIGEFSGAAVRALRARTVVSELERRAGEGGEVQLREARAEMAMRFKDLEPIRNRATIHKLTGIAAALLGGLVNCLSITYFIGTHRWCKEVIESYGFNEALIRTSSQLKLRALPWTIGGILAIVFIAATGGAADPGGNLTNASSWTIPHLWTALGGITIVALSFVMQTGVIADNVRLIEEVMKLVRERQADDVA